MSILEVSHIEKHFGATQVLTDISFSLEKGQALSIIGSSGSGKTTLLRCLNFLETPDSGRIAVRGRNLLDGSANVNTEDARVSYRQLRGTEAMVVETPDSVCQILWAAEGKGDWLFCAVGQNVELKTLLR